MEQGVKNWHALTKKQVLEQLDVDIQKGLGKQVVKLRQGVFGFNRLPKKKQFSSLVLFFSQFKNPLTLILAGAGVVTLAFGEYLDSAVIWVAVLLDVVVSYVQRIKVSNALEDLREKVCYESLVLRDGAKKLIDSEILVPGDIVILNAGDRVPADLRILFATNLKIDEKMLTGEWLPVEKKDCLRKAETPLFERKNMVYMGSNVINGKAIAVVVYTGLQTEAGKIAHLIKTIEDVKTPFQKKILKLSYFLAGFITLISLLIFIDGMIIGMDLWTIFINVLAIAVSAIPEGLPLAVTIILTIASKRIFAQKGLVKKLSATETLGSVSVIAFDKTGTLTMGQMKVCKVLTLSKILKKIKDVKAEQLVLKIGLLANKAFIEKTDNGLITRGAPTSAAILDAGVKAGLSKEKIEENIKDIIFTSFDSQSKYIVRVFKEQDKIFSYFSGMPEKILSFSSHFQLLGKREIMSLSDRKIIEQKLDSLTKQGLRVVAVAYGVDENYNSKNVEKLLEKNIEKRNLVFAGFFVIEDPLRKNVKDSISLCRKAGIRPILASGDHKLTVCAVANKVGFKINEKNIIQGKELDKLSQQEFEQKVAEIDVYARVEPRHKLRIMQMLQQKGEVVAMTGDGINDAPALKKADIGIALNSGSDVTKGVSDLILLSNSFDVIVGAIGEGRAVMDNIRKVITYLLSDVLTELILIGGCFLMRLPLPILPIQILWTNLIEDGLPDIALCFEPKEDDVMARQPIGKNESIFTLEMKVLIFVIGIIDDLFLFALFLWLLSQTNDLAYIRTMMFAGLSLDTVFAALSCKSLRKNIWHINFFDNKLLLFAILFAVVLLMLSTYLPALQTILSTIPLRFSDWALLFSIAFAELFLIEAVKFFFITHNTKTKTA